MTTTDYHKSSYQTISTINDESEEEEVKEETYIQEISNNKNAAFEGQFIRHQHDKLRVPISKLDDIKIDPIAINAHYLFDIIGSILYCLSLSATILCLIQLYNDYILCFYIILSFITFATITNIIWSFSLSNEVIPSYFDSCSRIWQLLLFFLSTVICSIIGPILWLFWYRFEDPEADLVSIGWCCTYLLLTSLPQGCILMVIVLELEDYNIYLILALICFIISSIFALWCISRFVIYRLSSDQLGNAFIFTFTCFIIDYFTAFFVIVSVCNDSADFVLKFYLYNALITVTAVSLIAYHPAAEMNKILTEDANLDDCIIIGKIILKLSIYLISFLYFILTIIIAELLCISAVNSIYVWMKSTAIENGMDWNLLGWIVYNNNNIFKCCNCRDKIKRLCLVNGLMMELDEENTTDNKKEKTLMLKQYLLENCRDNFNKVSFKQLKKYILSPPNFKKIAQCGWIDMDHDTKDYVIIIRLICIAIYVAAKITKYIFFPIIVVIYFIIKDENNLGIFIVSIGQCLFTLIGVIIIVMICMEIYYSYYFVVGNANINQLVRERIGYYYNTMSIYELRQVLTTYYFPNGVAETIVLFAQTASLQQLIEDEKAILDKEFKNINKSGLSKHDFNYLLHVLPQRYKFRFEKLNKGFEDFAGDDDVINHNEFKEVMYRMAEKEAKHLEFNQHS